MTYIPVPLQLLHRSVASVTDLLELKVVLSVVRRLASRRSGARCVATRELLLDPALAHALGSLAPEARSEAVASALAQACRRAILVCARHPDSPDETSYALNIPASRRALEAAGWSVLEHEVGLPPVQAPPSRSNIFELYEQNVGLVTPLLAEELQEAEQAYPPEWVEDAFREAVEYNRRNWRYVRRILENWATEGREEHGASRRRAEAARNRRRNLGGRFRPIAGRD